MHVSGQEAPFPDLFESCQEQVETYREQYDERIPVTTHFVECAVVEYDDADDEDIDQYFDEITDVYDELLEVDSEEYRDRFRNRTTYDDSLLEAFHRSNHWKMMRNMGVWGAFLGLANGGTPEGSMMTAVGGAAGIGIAHGYMVLHGRNENYINSTELIGISSDPIPKPKAYSVLAAELFHAYQDTFKSDTRAIPMLEEGVERGVRIRTLAEQTDEESMQKMYDAERSDVLVNAYATLCDEQDEPVEEQLREMGLTSAEADIVTDNIDNTMNREHNVGAAALQQAEEQHGDEIYENIFHGDRSQLPEWFHELFDTVPYRKRALKKTNLIPL